jgi:hypothetical protein
MRVQWAPHERVVLVTGKFKINCASSGLVEEDYELPDGRVKLPGMDHGLDGSVIGSLGGTALKARAVDPGLGYSFFGLTRPLGSFSIRLVFGDQLPHRRSDPFMQEPCICYRTRLPLLARHNININFYRRRPL